MEHVEVVEGDIQSNILFVITITAISNRCCLNTSYWKRNLCRPKALSHCNLAFVVGNLGSHASLYSGARAIKFRVLGVDPPLRGRVSIYALLVCRSLCSSCGNAFFLRTSLTIDFSQACHGPSPEAIAGRPVTGKVPSCAIIESYSERAR